MDSLNTDEILQKLLITIALDLHGRKNSLAAYLKSNEIVFISASSMKVGGATLFLRHLIIFGVAQAPF